MVDRHGSAQIVDEMDDGDDGDYDQSYAGQSTAVDLPAGVANTERSQTQGRRADDRNQEPAFVAIEADDDGQPLREGRLDAEAHAEVEYGAEGGDAAAANGEADRRPRLSRAERTRRQRDRFARIDRENQELRDQIGQLTQTMGQIEPRLSEIDQARRVSEVRDLNQRVQAFEYQAQLARQRVKDAMANQDPDDFEAALDARETAIRNVEAMKAQKSNLEAMLAGARQQPQQQRQEFQAAPRPAPLPVEVVNRVEDFADANPWYKPNDPNDLESQIILRVDDEVARAGFDPRTDAYWDEIEKRAARYLPHRFGETQPQNQRQESRPMPRQQQQQAPQRRGPMVAGGAQGNSPAPQSSNRVMITPARKQAMVETGIIAPDGGVIDRGRYNRLIAGYAQFDRDPANATR